MSTSLGRRFLIQNLLKDPGLGRWYNHLNSNIKRDAWTLEEEQALIDAHRIHGNKWAEIAKVLPGRWSSWSYFACNNDEKFTRETDISGRGHDIQGRIYSLKWGM